MLPKLLIPHPVITFCIFCCLQYQIYWNPYFAWCTLHLWVSRQSIVLLRASMSVRYLEYRICKTRNCSCSTDARFHHGLRKISCTVVPGKAAITWYMNYCHKATLRLPKMEHQNHWLSVDAHFQEGAVSMPLWLNIGLIGSQYLIHHCLQPVTTL